MSIWNKIFGGTAGDERVDYYEEGLALSQEGKFHEALTSFRLALKETPGDPVVLQQIAITYTRMGMDADAVKTYRHVLYRYPQTPGAHYGLAFILLRQGGQGEAIEHLEAFLAEKPTDEHAKDHVAHAEATLSRLRGEDEGGRDETE